MYIYIAIGKASMDELIKYLNVLKTSKQYYIIFNISNKEYLVNTTKICNNQLIDFPWKTVDEFTHIPTMECILSLCYSIHSWLNMSFGHFAETLEHKKHMSLINCHDGRTRTGLLIATYLKYSGSFITTTEAFHTFCKTRSISIPTLPASYRIFFNNFDKLMDKNFKSKLPIDYYLSDIAISNCPVDQLPSIEIWDSLGGKVFHSHEEGNYTWGINLAAPCIFSSQTGCSYYSTNCKLLSDFVIICRFGEVPSYSKQKAAVIFRYQNNALFLCPEKSNESLDNSLSVLLTIDDIDIFPQYKENFDENFKIKLTFKKKIKLLLQDNIEPLKLKVLPPNIRASFDRGLVEVIIVLFILLLLHIYCIYII